MKTLIVGSFGARNVGDEMILASALEKYPDGVVLTSEPEFCKRFQERKDLATVLPFPTGLRSWVRFISHPEGTLRELKGQVDKIVFPGGGLLAIRDRAWWIWGSTVWGLRKMFPNARIEMESQGIDIPKNDWQKFWLNRVITCADKITVRDESGFNLVNVFGGRAKVVGDAAENWLKKKIGTRGLNPLPQKRRKKILINARAKYDGVWPKADVFMAMEPSDAKFVPRNFKGKVVFPDTVSEAIELFGSAKKVVGQRLHFLIMAKSCGCEDVSTLGEPYAEKVVAWLKRQEDK